MTTQADTYRFRGGVRIGLWANTWPNGILDISQSALVLRDKMRGKELKFSKQENIRIEIKKIVPIIGYGIRIHHTNEDYSDKIYFWYPSFRFVNLINALNGCGWLAK